MRRPYLTWWERQLIIHHTVGGEMLYLQLMLYKIIRNVHRELDNILAAYFSAAVWVAFYWFLWRIYTAN